MADILTCYYRPKPGGLCTRLFRAVEALLESGHTVHYLSLQPFPIRHPGCRFHRFPWPVAKSDTLLFWAVFHLLAPLWLIMVGIRNRITHAFAFGPTYAFLLQPLRRIKGIRLTCFFRADTLENHVIKGRPRWILTLEKWIEGMAIHGIHVVGVAPELTRAIVGRHPKRAPLTASVLLNDLPKVAATTRSNNRGPLKLAVVGILEARKNQAFALEVVSRLPKDGWHLSLFGVGPDRQTLQDQVAKLNLKKYIRFMGWVANEFIWPEVDLLLAPSFHEGMPNAVLEAVSHGIPVLASDISAHAKILPACQLLPLDAHGKWVKTIVLAMADSETWRRDCIARQLRASSHLRFDWDTDVVHIILGR